jgi:NTP pyrophosphatase (non-canonical NTP hydrolase)
MPSISDLTFDSFSEKNRRRCESPDGFNHPLEGWSTSDWFVAMMGELGEAANIVKKLNRVRDDIPGNKETKEELLAGLRKELGDLYVYLDLTAQACGFHIVDAAVEVFDAKSVQIGSSIRMDVE